MELFRNRPALAELLRLSLGFDLPVYSRSAKRDSASLRSALIPASRAFPVTPPAHRRRAQQGRGHDPRPIGRDASDALPLGVRKEWIT